MYEQFFFIILAAIALVAMTFIPVYLHVYTYYQTGNRKTGIHIDLFGMVKLLGGYITTCPGGIAVHKSNQKALIFSYREMDDGRKKYAAQKGISLEKVCLYTVSRPEYYVQLSLLEGVAKTIALFFNQTRCIIKSKTVMTGEDCVRIYAKATIKIAVYRQIIELIKYFLGRMAIWRKKTKS